MTDKDFKTLHVAEDCAWVMANATHVKINKNKIGEYAEFIFRITSYNVCYTKLLRSRGYHQCYPRNICYRLLVVRITSYNVCYTKLLRLRLI